MAPQLYRQKADLCGQAIPEYLSVLTTSFPRGKSRVEKGYKKNIEPGNQFEQLSARESLEELKMFLESLDIPCDAKTIFRSDHASNYLVLKGRLGRDKERLTSEVQQVLDAPESDDSFNLRPEWARGL